MITLVDTGALVALLDRADHHHQWAISCFKSLKPPLISCEAVMAEAWHLLGEAPPSRKALAALHKDKLLRCDFEFESQSSEIWKLLQKYADTPMDFADACLVRLSEVLPSARVWTTDSDFKVYRRLGRQVIHLLAPWQ